MALEEVLGVAVAGQGVGIEIGAAPAPGDAGHRAEEGVTDADAACLGVSEQLAQSGATTRARDRRYADHVVADRADDDDGVVG